MGDWTPWVRDGIDLLRLVILAGAAAYAVDGQWGSAALLAALGSITLVARLVNLPRLYDLALTLGMALQGFGETLGLYDQFVRFDDLVHFTLPMLTAPVVYIALARLDVVPDPRDETHLQHYVGIGVVTAALGIAIGALWEVFEWRPGAGFGGPVSASHGGTQRDLFPDTLGSGAGGGALGAWGPF